MTVPHEQVEMVRMAVAEVSTCALDRIYANPDYASVLSLPSNLPMDVRHRALRLVRWRTDGPEALVVCDRHAVPSNPTAWEMCETVRVVDALRGRTCGEPS